MDNRLDFVNNVSRHSETLTDDDTLLVISHNKKQGDLFYQLIGDWENISIIMSNKEAVNHNEYSKEKFDDIKKLILNTTLNICEKDPNILDTLLGGLQKLKISKNTLVVKADKHGYVECPFCKEKHKHGKAGGNGNRKPDCNSFLTYNPVNGRHYQHNGYYVVFD